MSRIARPTYRLYISASLGGRRGVVRIGQNRKAELFLSGPGIVGLAFIRRAPWRGRAGSGGETAPVGTVYAALADVNGVRVAHRQFLGDRERIRQFTTKMALDMLRRRILGL